MSNSRCYKESASAKTLILTHKYFLHKEMRDETVCFLSKRNCVAFSPCKSSSIQKLFKTINVLSQKSYSCFEIVSSNHEKFHLSAVRIQQFL